MNLIPGLGLRASEEAEVLGMDDAEIGEFAVSIPLPNLEPKRFMLTLLVRLR